MILGYQFRNIASVKILLHMDEAELALELLGLEGKGYQALFLSGGASLDFNGTVQLMKDGKSII
jgi:hypothetical protein